MNVGRQGVYRAGILLVLGIAMALTVAISARDTPFTIASFAAGADTKLCDSTGGSCSESLGVGAATDVTLSITLGNGSVMPSQVVWFTPQGATISDFQAAPLGAAMGRVDLSGYIAFGNNPCNTFVSVSFPLMNAVTDTTAQVHPVGPEFSGDEGPFEPYRDDVGTNLIPRHVEAYPSYLIDLLPGITAHARYAGSVLVAGEAIVVQLVVLSPGALASVQPPNPLADLASTSLGYPVLLVLQDPNGEPAPGSISDFCSPLDIDVLLWSDSRDNPCTGGSCSNDDTACAVSCGYNGDINGLPGLGGPGGTCSGNDEGGCTRYTNPSTPGTHLFYVFQQSQRDLDGDGIENAFDTCPYAANSDGDPRTTAGSDGDMIDSICDPTPSSNSGSGNHDGDTLGAANWLNAADNCPLVVNTDQADGERIQAWSVAAPRGGSRTDQIGDVCDSNPTRADGQFHTVWTTIPKCIGDTDFDGDGWCSGNDPNDSDAGKTPEDIAWVVRLPLAATGSGTNSSVGGTVSTGLGLAKCDSASLSGCNGSGSVANDGTSVLNNADDGGSAIAYAGAGHPYQACNDGDGWIDLLDSGCEIGGADIGGVDTDGDGYSDNAEFYIGTDAFGRCEVEPNPASPVGPKHSTDWPSDLDSTTPIPSSIDKISITDYTAFLAPTPRLGTSPGDAGYSPRFDLVPGKTFPFTTWIALNDLTALISGDTGFPPMFGGAKALGGPACTADPTYGD